MRRGAVRGEGVIALFALFAPLVLFAPLAPLALFALFALLALLLLCSHYVCSGHHLRCLRHLRCLHSSHGTTRAPGTTCAAYTTPHPQACEELLSKWCHQNCPIEHSGLVARYACIHACVSCHARLLILVLHLLPRGLI